MDAGAGEQRRRGLGGGPVPRSEPLTVEAALAKGEQTKDINGFQRAAAIEASPRTLKPLYDRYRSAGDAQRAEVIARQLALSEDIKLVPQGVVHLEGEPYAVEWRHHTYVGSFDLGPMSARELEREGLAIGETWWLLPAQGPAVKGTLVRGEREVWNECGGDQGVALYIDAAPSSAPVAAMRAEPPASWHHPGPQPKRSEKEAEALVKAWLEAEGQEQAGHHLAPAPEGWRAQIVWFVEDPEEQPEADWYDETDMVVQLSIPDEGPVRELSRGEELSMNVGYPVTFRDVDGDGDIDQVWDDCSTELLDADGTLLRSSTYRCCGC